MLVNAFSSSEERAFTSQDINIKFLLNILHFGKRLSMHTHIHVDTYTHTMYRCTHKNLSVLHSV